MQTTTKLIGDIAINLGGGLTTATIATKVEDAFAEEDLVLKSWELMAIHRKSLTNSFEDDITWYNCDCYLVRPY